MKNLGMIGIITAMALAVGGCASTSESKEPVFPELKVLSDKTYVWDDSISEALNVAQMAQPAGVGVGMRDFADGTKANTGRVGAGEQLFDSAIGLAGMGAFGLLSMGVLNSDVNAMVDWAPSFVFLIPTEDIMAAGKYDLKRTQNVVGRKIEASLKNTFSDIKWHGEFTSKLGDDSNATYAFNTSQCHNALKPYYVNEANAPQKAHYSNKLFFEAGTFDEFCAVRLELKISGFFYKAERLHAIVVGEVLDGHFFLDALKNIDGYMLFPESFAVPTVDSSSGKIFRLGYAFAMKNGTELRFQK